ncbi:MAG: helix-turn-helix domain-containing protein [Serratia sp. (in: enterobacteria)]|uniref:winged helix-turn-helix transcriptional regulator n=1 Tax=Serratia sp. (in: enterobacteria) TaxID=616 RepID=UPI003F3DB1E6
MSIQDHHATDDFAATVELFEQLSPYATFDDVLPGNRLYLFKEGGPYCYLIRSGICKLHHGPDEILINTMYVPSIIGIGGVLTANRALFLQTHTRAEIATVTTHEIRQIIARLNLWELLSRHIYRVTNRFFMLSSYLNSPTAYEILRFQLLELMDEPTEFRDNISAVQYIQQKTRLSRSSIMKILSQLKQGGVVKLENGILKEVCHLPLKY